MFGIVTMNTLVVVLELMPLGASFNLLCCLRIVEFSLLTLLLLPLLLCSELLLLDSSVLLLLLLDEELWSLSDAL